MRSADRGLHRPRPWFLPVANRLQTRTIAACRDQRAIPWRDRGRFDPAVADATPVVLNSHHDQRVHKQSTPSPSPGATAGAALEGRQGGPDPRPSWKQVTQSIANPPPRFRMAIGYNMTLGGSTRASTSRSMPSERNSHGTDTADLGRAASGPDQPTTRWPRGPQTITRPTRAKTPRASKSTAPSPVTSSSSTARWTAATAARRRASGSRSSRPGSRTARSGWRTSAEPTSSIPGSAVPERLPHASIGSWPAPSSRA